MDNFFSSIAILFKMFNDLISPAHLLSVGFISGFLAFIVAIIIVIMFRKKILVTRKHIILTIFSYLYLFFIPILVAFSTSSWFIINSAEKEIVKNLPSFFNNETFNINAQFKSIALKSFDKEDLNQSLGDVLDKVEHQSKKKLFEEKVNYQWTKGDKIDAIIDYFILKHPKIFREYVAKTMNEQLGNEVMSKEVAHQVLDENILAMLDQGIMTKFVELQTVNILKGLKMKIFWFFFIIMLLPILEILWANRSQKYSYNP